MKSVIVALALCMAYLLDVHLCAASSLSGAVVDDFSLATVPGVKIIISGRLHASLQADENGRFQSADLAPGDYGLAIGREGYLYTSVALHLDDKAGDDDPSKHLLIRLVRLGGIAEHVEGLSGRSARVMALIRSGDSTAGGVVWKPVFDTAIVWRGKPERGVPVDTNGDFRIQNLPPGTYALLVAYDTGLIRYPEGDGGFKLGRDGVTLSIQIPAPGGLGRTIEGHVDLPESQSWYWLTLSRPDQPALAITTTTSDNDGEFAFRGIIPGSYEILAVPGIGEPRARPAGPVPVYEGFARVTVDVREKDMKNVRITPGQQIGGTVALRESGPAKPPTRCSNGQLVLTPLEDWGVNLERMKERVSVTLRDLAPSPEFMAGLAPARYGVDVRAILGCRLQNQSVLDLRNKAPANADAQVMEPGTIGGHARLAEGQMGTWEVLLIPDDMAEGLSFLPANWFRDPAPDLEFGWGSFWGIYGPEQLPYIHAAPVNHDGSFEFGHVGAGHYRVVLRSADPGVPNLNASGEDLKRIEVPAAGRVEIDLTTAPQ
jgi:hypothetical protein